MNAIRLRAGIWLLLAIGIAGYCLMAFQNGAPIQTNLLSLLPPTERNPVAERAIGQLAEVSGNRALFLIGDSSAARARQAAETFATQLRASAAFKHVQARIPPVDPNQLSALYQTHRFNLLSEADRRALATGDADLENRLQRKLYAPFRFGWNTPLARDPFGFTDNWLDQLSMNRFKLEPDDGFLRTSPTKPDQPVFVFVGADLSGSAYDSALQATALNAINEAENNLRKNFSSVEILRTGPLFYAAAARAQAKHDMDFIGAGSLLGMLLLMYWLFRSPQPLLLGLLSVAFGITAAVATTISIQHQLHLITLVFGASLIGEAIDYSIQYFAAHLSDGPRWEPMRGLRQVLPSISMALATSALGYAALALAPFAALKQIALFALVGLCAAYVSVILLLPACMRQPNKRDALRATAGPQRVLHWWMKHMSVRRCSALAFVCVLISVPAFSILHADDDVRLLIDRPAQLVQQENKIRALTGFDTGSQFFLIEGASADAVLANEEALRKALQPLIGRGALAGYQAISAFVPSAATQQQNRELWYKAVLANQSALRALFERNGLEQNTAAAMQSQFAQSDGELLTLEQWLAAPISTPYRHLWLGHTANGYAAVLLPLGARDMSALAACAKNIPGVSWVDKPASVSNLFRTYRVGGMWALCVAAILVLALLALRYGAKNALALLTPAVLGMLLAVACFAYAGIAWTLFSMMALVLVLGVGVNYAIFLYEGGEQRPATWSGVLLSAGTTLLSFGLLAFSSMPLLADFGLTLLVGIGAAVLLSPMVLSMTRRRPPHQAVSA